LLVPPDADSIAGGLLKVLNETELRESMSLASRHRAARFYSWDQVCEAYEGVLTAAIQSASS
jgi:glycosyltransferase involved in cell wall biosynthesis